MIDLRPTFSRIGRELVRGIATRLRAGQGYRGRLAGKREADGQPLGGQLPQQIEVAPLTVTQDGVSALMGEAVERFDHGSPRQPARPILGYTRAERVRWTREVARDVAKQVTASLRGGP